MKNLFVIRTPSEEHTMCKLCIQDEEKFYFRDKNLKREDVEVLQNWMSKESHLPKISNFQIISFLSSCYYKIEATKNCIENYYSLKSHCPEIFSSRSLKNISLNYHVNTILFTNLPKMTKNGFQILYAKVENNSPDKFNFTETVKVLILNVVLNNYQNGPQNGHIFVIDGAGLQLGHIFKINLLLLKRFFYFLQEAAPIRLKQIHILNVSPITEKLMNLIKPFLKNELVDQIHCHGKLEEVFKFIEKEVLPNDYGGDIGSIKEIHQKQIININNHIEMLIEDEKVKTDETRRSEIPKRLEELFGIVGTFKKLSID